MNAVLELLPEAAGDGEARAWLDDHGLPTRRDEAWKYTPLDAILAGGWAATPATVDRELVDRLAGNHGGPRLVFVDGALAADLSDLAGLPGAVRCGRGTAPAGRPSRYDGFQALNHAAASEAAVVEVGPGSCAAEVPLHVVHVTTGAVTHPRTVVDIGAGAQLTLVESYAAVPGRTFTNASTSIRLGDGARFVHRRFVTGAPESVHVGHTSVTQARDAEYTSWSLLAGAEVARNAVDVVLAGEGARAELQGLSVPSGEQHHDTVVTVEHAASRCTSRQVFRGVVDDRARSSFSGHVIVRPHTAGNDAGQTSRSLLLQPTAQADSRPWLEIFADDVRCTHGATVGRLDEQALFYLRSRGIPREEARAMLVHAFVAELTGALHVPSVRAFVEAAVRGAVG